jgi:hypothetical protein
MTFWQAMVIILFVENLNDETSFEKYWEQSLVAIDNAEIKSHLNRLRHQMHMLAIKHIINSTLFAPLLLILEAASVMFQVHRLSNTHPAIERTFSSVDNAAFLYGREAIEVA